MDHSALQILQERFDCSLELASSMKSFKEGLIGDRIQFEVNSVTNPLRSLLWEMREQCL